MIFFFCLEVDDHLEDREEIGEIVAIGHPVVPV